MSRTTATVLASLLFAAHAAAQSDEPPAADPALGAPVPSVGAAAESEMAADAEEDFADDETYDEEGEGEEEYYEGDFCGGGEETQVTLASYELEEGNVARARRMIVEALQNGQVEGWERPYALSVLAEAQLRLGAYQQAAVNYRKALRIDADSAPASRVGLATALYLGGSQRAAREEATTARDILCSDQYSYMACFGAQAVLAATERDASDRDVASQAMETIRAAHPENEEQFEQTERRIERAQRRARGGRQ
jgi:tetratricopeptide (TPR) repeat protein